MLLAKLGAGERSCIGGSKNEEIKSSMKSCNEIFTRVYVTDKALKKAVSLKNILRIDEPTADDLPEEANACTTTRPKRGLARKHSSMHNLMYRKMPELTLKALVSKKKKPIVTNDQRTSIGSTKKDGIRRSNSKPHLQASPHRKISQKVSLESKNSQDETECKANRRSMGRKCESSPKLSKLALETCGQGKTENKDVLSLSKHSLGSSWHSEKSKKTIRAKRLSSKNASVDSVRPMGKAARTYKLIGSDGRDIEQSPNEETKTNCQRLSSNPSLTSLVRRASKERRRSSSSKNRRKASSRRSLVSVTKQSSKNRNITGESATEAKPLTIKKALMQKLRNEVTASSHQKKEKEPMKSARRSCSQRRLCSLSQKQHGITPSTSQSRLWSLQPSLPSYLWGPPEMDTGSLEKRESDIKEMEASERDDSSTTTSSSDSVTVEVSNRSGRKVLDVNSTTSRWDSCNCHTVSLSPTQPIRVSVGMPPLMPLLDTMVDKRPSLPKRSKSGSCPCPRVRSITIDLEEEERDARFFVMDTDGSSVISELTML